MDALNDPKLLAEAKKQTLAITPLSGPEVAAMVTEVYSSSPEALQMARAIVTSKEKLERRKENFYTVEVKLMDLKKKNRELHFMDKGKSARAVLSGGRHGTKISIGGKKAKRSKLKAGMTCKVTYEGDLTVAKTVACN